MESVDREIGPSDRHLCHGPHGHDRGQAEKVYVKVHWRSSDCSFPRKAECLAKEERRNLAFSPYPGQTGMEANEPDEEVLCTQLGTVHGEAVGIVDGNSCTMGRQAFGFVRWYLNDGSRGMSDSMNEAM